jgi:hypothetical protein
MRERNFSQHLTQIGIDGLLITDDCEMTKGTRKACKNCTCGRAQQQELSTSKPKLTLQMLENPGIESSCGNVLLPSSFSLFLSFSSLLSFSCLFIQFFLYFELVMIHLIELNWIGLDWNGLDW